MVTKKEFEEMKNKESNTDKLKIMCLENQIKVNKIREEAIDELRRNLNIG